jgi:hypothetical protein
MAEAGRESAPRDRKLGDEWNDWKGERDPREREIDEKPATFLWLASAVLALFLLLMQLGWFLVEPRFEQIDPAVARLAGWAVTGLMIGFLLILLLEGVLLERGRSFLPYAWAEKLLLALLPRTIWLGGKFDISKDRIGNSFLKLHNLITRNYLARQKPGRLLVLLPRCLRKESRTELTNRLSGENFKVYTAAGGEEARKAIMEYRPSRILAIACERDLMSGIKDVASRIPVLAIPNKRPEGPCKNTELALPELEEALRTLLAGSTHGLEGRRSGVEARKSNGL